MSKNLFLQTPSAGDIENIYKEGAEEVSRLSLPPFPGVHARRPAQSTGTGFDAAVNRVFKHEGGYTASDGNSGAPANFGINQKHNPDVDVRNITQDDARQIYKARYWDAIGGDNLPPEIQSTALDAAVNQGPANARKWLEQSGDVSKFNALRRQHYEALAARPEYAKYRNTWLRRLSDYEADAQGGNVAGRGISDPASLQSQLDQEEPGRYQVLTPEEAQRLEVQSTLDAEEPGRFKVLSDEDLDQLPLSAFSEVAPETQPMQGAEDVSLSENGFWERLPQVAKTGWDNMTRSLDVSRAVLSDDFSPQTVDLIASNIEQQIKQADADKPRQHESERELKDAIEQFGKTEGVWDTTTGLFSLLGTVFANPKGVAIGSVEQIANMLPSVGGAAAGAGVGAAAGSVVPGAGTGAGAAIGALWGSRAGLAAGTAALEFGNEITEAITSRLSEQNLQPTRENISSLLADPAMQSEIKSQAAKKGLTLAAVDALTMGIAGKVGGKGVDALRAGNRGQAAKYGAGALGIEAAGEPVGEAASQLVARGEIDKADVAAEAIYGVPASVTGAAIGTGTQVWRDRAGGTTPPPSGAAPGSATPQGPAPTATPQQPATPVTPQQPAPAPSGPITRAMEKAAGTAPAVEPAPAPAEAQPAPVDLPRVRMTAENGETMTGVAEEIGPDGSARIIGDDGQVYVIGPDDGVAVEPIADDQPAAATEVLPAPVDLPKQPETEQAPVDALPDQVEPPAQQAAPLAGLTEDDLRAQLRAVTQQAKQEGMTQELRDLRRMISSEIDRRNQERENEGRPASDSVPVPDDRHRGDTLPAQERADQQTGVSGAEAVHPGRGDAVATVEDEAPVGEGISRTGPAADTEPALTQEHAVRTDGTPFKTEAAARQAARNRRMEGYRPVQVEGGWALARSQAKQEEEPAAATGDPMLDSPASWVIRNKETGEVVGETFERAQVDALNTEKYEAVPVAQHLREVNAPESQAGQVARAEQAPQNTARKPKQPDMPRQDFDSAAGVGKISAVKDRYGDKFGVSWASTEIATADTMEEAAAIAKEIAESGAFNISGMRDLAQHLKSKRAAEVSAQSTEQYNERVAVEGQAIALRQRENNGEIASAKGTPFKSRQAAQKALSELPESGEFARDSFGLYERDGGFVLRRYDRDGTGYGAVDANWVDQERASQLRDERRQAFMQERGLVEDKFGNMVTPEEAQANNAEPDEGADAQSAEQATQPAAAQQTAPARVNAKKQDQAKEPREMTEEGRAKDGGPIMPGDTFRTLSGRVTTPYPKQKSERYASQWLIDNATAEAESRGDDFNARAFDATTLLKGGQLTDADRDSMLMYLFEEQPDVAPSILRPLTQEAAPEQAAQPTPAAPPAKAKPKRLTAKQRQQQVADYFTPGNIVQSYSGHDRVVSYSPPDANGNWSVRVRAVRKEGDEWVDAPKEDVRAHSTMPEDRLLQRGPVERAQPAAAAPVAAPSRKSDNKIFTDDAAEKARALLRSKLSQLNSGIDPEVMQAGITLAGWHIEKGARAFADFARSMIEDMGEGVKPYLKSWYLGAKFDPRSSTLEGTSTAAEVESFDVDNLDAAAEAQPAPEQSQSDTEVVVTPAGREIEVRYRVVEGDSLIPSNLDDGRVNPDYPQELQPRNRSKAASELQITNIAANMNPRLLGESASTTDGAPIVSDGGVVESGNGRTMAILRSYRRGLDSAQAYRDWLASQGYDVSGMTAPVLVRERVTPMSQSELVEYTRESNARTTMQMAPEEQARTDADHMARIIDLYVAGDIGSAANRPFVRSFIEDVVPQSEHGDMVTDGGALSIRGRKRIEAALMHAAYGDERMVADLFVDPSAEIKTIGGALLDTAAQWLKMRNNADPSLDVTPQLVAAVNIVRRAREEDKSIYDVANQIDVFSGATDPVTMDFLGMFFRGDRFNRQRSREAIGDMLYGYAASAEKIQPGPDMFGMEPPGAQEILRTINEKRQREEHTGQQGDIFAPGAQADDRNAAGRSGAGQGPGAQAQDASPQESGGPVNAPGSNANLERDRQNAAPGESVVPETDGDVAGRNDRRTGGAGQSPDAATSAGRGNQRVPGDCSAAGRERGDKPVHRADGQFQPTGRPAGDPEPAGSSSDRSEGSAVEREREAAVANDAHAPGADDLPQRLAAQRKAKNTPTKWGNKASIDAALPLLLPEQREDVLKAENRLADNNGILFTNGTGTGKTASGLGVAKRFINDGKDNIVIVVPSDKIASDWVKFARMLGVNLKQLADTTDNGGSGPVITTYANFGQNESLAQRDWDLVIADESHYLSSNENGDGTAALSQLRALTRHHNGFSHWVRQRFPKEWQAYRQAMQDRADANSNLDIGPDRYAQIEAAESRAREKWKPIEDRERAKWDARWEKQDSLPKTVMLSATPFAYAKNTDYAEGYLFHYIEPANLKRDENRGGGYNSGGPRDRFMMQHFGYRMRYNKLTAPEAGVNSQLMEQQFNEWLKSTGALSGRRLEVPFDYDRKFVMVDDAVGTKIDEGLKFLREAEDGRYRDVYEAVMGQFDYQRRMYLLESMKARAAVPIIRQHLEAGRKVVVFHDFNKGGGFDPFQETIKAISDPDVKALARSVLSKPMFKIDFRGLASPIETLGAAFPDTLFFNGTVPKGQRRANADLFNDDESGRNLIVVQSDAGREGVSLHDTTGKHQRVEINLGMPVKPVAATQIEGRIYRTGQASDAIFRYLTTGTAWEASAFASKIAERASTAENLALGSDARGLKEAFIDAYLNAGDFPVSDQDGKGGKDNDRALSAALTTSPFERAKTFYWAQQKNTRRRDQREGVDYFATPEPVGFKMVEWAGIQPNDKVLEPSAGHGAIARFFPEQSDVTMVEPSYELSQRAGLANGNARIVNDTFEALHINNKYDAIVMNPPYGSGGKTSTEHLAKAAKHLRNGGRIVALVPRGGMADKRLDAFLESDDAEGLYQVARIDMPSVTFERAGTAVNSQILVLERHENPEDAADINARWIDLSGAESINELFDRLENVSVQARKAPSTPEPRQEIVEHVTAKGKTLRGVIRTDLTKEEAQEIDRFTFRKKNAEGQTGWFIRAKHLDEGAKFSIAPATNTPAFRRWFGDSVVVDEQGDPLVVYHGTDAQFTTFDPAKQGSNTGWDNTRFGFFFIADRQAAQDFARDTSGGTEIMDVYLSIQKPLRIMTPDFFTNAEQAPTLYEIFTGERLSNEEALAALEEEFDLGAFSEIMESLTTPEARDILERDGFDGVISQFGGGHLEYVAFRPEQIKSATSNRGTFDASNPDIRYSVADSAQLRQALTGGDLGALVGRLIERSQVVLHDTVSTVPVDRMPTGVQAVSTPDGKIHLVADALTAQSARPVLLHEAFHQGGERLIGSKAWGGLLSRLGSIHRQAKQSGGRAREFYDAARRSVSRAQQAGVPMSEDLTAEEFGAYTIEHYDQAPAAFRKWVDDVVGALKAWLLRRFGIQAGAVTPAQLRALAVAALRNEAAPTGGARFSVAPPTNSPAFRRWFGDSKVVDESGEPKIVYHGSRGEINEFQMPAFFTSDRDGAEWYSADRSGGDGGSITIAYLAIQNPLDSRSAKGTQEFVRLAKEAGVEIEGDVMEGTFYAPAIAEHSDYDGSNFIDLIYIPAVRSRLMDHGYDGVVLDDLLGSSEIETWIAFRPEQIKSATDNVGTFDGNNPDIRYSIKPSQHFKDLTGKQKDFLDKIGPERLPQRLADRWRQLTDNLGLRIRQAGVDRYASLLRNDQAIHGEDTLEGSIASSAWVLARMSHSAGGALSAMLNHGRIYLDPTEKVIDVREGTKGLRDVFQQLGTPMEVDRFMAWIAANRARQLKAQGRENLFTSEEIDAGINLSTGRMDDGGNRGMAYAKAWKEFQQYRDDVLRIAEEAGTISTEQRELWSEEFYVPFYRVLDEDTIGGPSMSSGLSRQQAYKRLKGGKQNLNDLLENTLLNYHHLIQSALKNQAARQAVENAQALGIAAPTTEANRNKKASTFVMQDGVKQWYDISDPLTFKALSALNSTGLNTPLMKVGRAFKRLFTNMTTVTPQFMIANTLRDSLSAMATSPTSGIPFKNAVKGAAVYGNDQNRARMLASGASFSFGHVYGQNADEVKASLRGTLRNARVLNDPALIPGVLMGAWRKWNQITDFAENVNRAGIWERNQGRGKLKAAFEARDLMDFSAHGEALTVRILTDLVPFLNARIQGLDKLYRSGFKPGAKVIARKGTKTDKAAFARFAAVTGALSVMSMMLYLNNMDDEEFRKLEDWQRDTYWFFRIGENAFFIPKPFEVGAIATLAERGLEQFMDPKVAGKKFAERLGHMLTDTFSLDLPQIIKPAYELSANRNTFTGRPIEDMGMQKLSPSLRVKPGTTRLAEGASRAMEAVAGDFALSPLQIDHLIGAYLGQVGAGTVALSDVIWRRAMGEELPARTWSEYQPIRRFYRDLGAPAPYTRYSTDFYNALKEADKAYANVQHLLKYQEFERADSMMEKEADKLELRRWLNKTQRDLSKINAEMRQVQIDKEMSGEEKRFQLDRLRELRNMITEEVGKELEQERIRKREQGGSR